jgi:hypothetical protein
MKLRNIAVATMLCLLSVAVLAQRETGTLSGTVTDSTGAVISTGKISVRSTTTGAVRTAPTNGSGLYSVPDLQPGIYEVTIEAPGFAMYKGKVEVTVGTGLTFNAAMKVAGTAEVVEVTAGESEVTKVNTENQTLSTTITAREVLDLPSLTRNAYDFVKTSGNVTEGAYGAQGMLTARGAGVSINGQRAASTDLLLDGAENVDIFNANVGQQVPLDSVQEFSVLTSNFTAEYGRAGGGVVNVATKSGSNSFHGTGYEFNRISALASNSPDNNANGLAKGVYTRNQFGYSLGGPIKKDKLFFFSSTELTRVRSQQQNIFWVPDPAFIALSNANTRNFFSKYGTLRSGLTTLGTKTAGALGFGAVPAATAVFDKVAYAINGDAGAGTPQNTYNTVNRVDYNFSDKTNMYVRYAYSNEADFIGTNNTSPYVGYDTGQTNKNHNGLVSLTHVFLPTLVSVSKLTVNRLNNFQPLAGPPSPTLYFQSSLAYTLDGLDVVNPGYVPTNPAAAIPFGGPQNLIQLSQDLSWTRGNHQFRFGGAYLNMRDNRTFGAFENAVEALSSGSGSTTGLTNFFNGTLSAFNGAINPQGKFPCPRNLTTGALTTDPIQLANCTVTLPLQPPNFSRMNRYNDGSIYAQDEWKFRRNLTLNLGLRWEYFGVQHDANSALDSNFYFGSGSSFFDRIRNGQMLTVPNSSKGALWNPGGGFAPRVGFAWDPFGTGKTSIRGGYGLSYERNFGNVTFNVIQNPPNYFVLGLQSVGGSPIAISTNNAGPLAGTGSALLPPSTGRIVDPNISTAYAEFWSFAAQREVAKNTLLSLEYTGSNGIHLYDISNINQVGTGGVYEGDTANPLNRLDPQFSNLNYRSSRGFSRYNALNVGLRSTNLFRTGLQFNTNYTWSHAIDNLSTTFSESTNNANLGYLDPFNPNLDKGNADFDSRHRLVTSAIWDVPWAKNMHNPVLRQAFGGWSFAPIFNIYSGNPYTMYDCTNGANRCPRLFTNAKGSSAGNTLAGPNLFNWFNTPASAFPMTCDHIDTATGNCVYLPTSYSEPITGLSDFPTCSGTKGVGCQWPSNMVGRNSFRGPGFWNVDMGAYKKFKLTERFSMQLRGEMYNMFNHHPFAMVGGNNDVSALTFEAPGTPGVSTLPATSLPSQVKKIGNRDVQLGLKIIF